MNLAEMIQTLVAGGASIEGAVKQLGKAGVPAALLADAQLLYEQRVGRIRELRDPGALVEEKDKGYWYGGEGANDLFWPALRSRLAQNLDGDAIRTISNASDRIVGLLRPPGAPEIRTRGLVLGYVQSGKTTSFMSVIAKGADVGYRLFIVMSGITDNLRSQTQARLEEALVGDLHAKWHLLTSLDSDFQLSGNAANLLANPEQRLMAVVKKNPYRLRRLMKWLDSAGELALRNCPILLIDDEADQASIDVGKKGRTSKINGRILQILDKPKAGYVAYTATPFANLLIDPNYPQGLYPRDFIVDLPRSPDYFGPERIFGREALTPEEEGSAITDGMDIIRHVLDAQLRDVQPPRGRGAVYTWTPVLTDSLRDAISWFVLATAARRARGAGNKHSSMLVHTSMLAEAHVRLATPIQQLIDDWRGHLASRAHLLWADLEARWEAEADRVPPEAGLTRLAWSDVQPHVQVVADETRIVVDNFRSTDRLNYPRDEAVTAIVIGGNTLSRGLTLEGLVCSYFARGASAYDTLLQMGRWFGYRRGYSDLVRVWMTGALESWFFDLATIEHEVRNEIRRYEEGAELVTPAQLPVRIRTHPFMRITAANKMGGAVAVQISYGNTRQQTILFHHKDKDWLRNNLDATRRLLATVAACAVPGGNRDGRPFFKDVSSADVLTFLAEYQMHESATAVRAASLADYIEQQNKHGYLTRWNIVVMQHPDAGNGTVGLGLPAAVNLIQRAKMDIPGIPHANVKAIVSTIDRVADLDQPVGEIHRMAAGTADKDLLAVREDLVGDVGLLCLYPISKNSAPRPVTKPDGIRRRVKLEAEEHVIGAAFFFPSPKGPQSAVSYMAVPAIEPEPEELEEIEADIDALDAADEEHGEAQGAADATA